MEYMSFITRRLNTQTENQVCFLSGHEAKA